MGARRSRCYNSSGITSHGLGCIRLFPSACNLVLSVFLLQAVACVVSTLENLSGSGFFSESGSGAQEDLSGSGDFASPTQTGGHKG